MTSITVGHIAGASIIDLFLETSLYPGCPEFLYIACLDSRRGNDLGIYAKKLVDQLPVKSEAKMEGLLLRVSDLGKLLDETRKSDGYEFFPGWDECYLLRSESGADLSLGECRMTSERSLVNFTIEGEPEINCHRLSKVVPWAIKASCDLCLGDGSGLNYVALSPGAQMFMMEIEKQYAEEAAEDSSEQP